MRKLMSVAMTISLTLLIVSPAEALSVPNSFIALANSPILAKPGILVIDPISQSEIFANQAEVPRAPASILKLISTVTAITAFGQDKTFKTSISATEDPNTFVLLGEYDPWLTTSRSESKDLNRALSTKLISAISEEGTDLNATTIKFNGLFEKDITNLRAFYGKKINFERITKTELKSIPILSPVAEVSSPTLSEIIGFTLLWSDNTLADRLARNAADELGFTRDSDGMNKAFQQTLQGLNV